MKCEICNYQQTPDNMKMLETQASVCSSPLCKTGTVVWRDGQLTLTLNPAENEHVFDAKIVEIPPAPEPPVVKPVQELQVSMKALETTHRAKVNRDRDRNDD
jgi:hypothetical protein